MMVRPAYAISMVLSITAACTGAGTLENLEPIAEEAIKGSRGSGSPASVESGGTTDVGGEGDNHPEDPGKDDPTAVGGTGGMPRSDGGSAGTKNDAGAIVKGGGQDGSTGSTPNPGETSITTTECTDIQTADHQGEPCSIWVDWGHCSADWLQGFCNKTCGRCNSKGGSTPSTGAGGKTGGGGGTTTPQAGPTVTRLGGDAKSGWASRYWDCCKPHCAWPGNAPSGALKMCTASNGPLSDPSAKSSCDNGGSAYTCWDMAPWAVSETLAYGYAATPAGGNDCGKCYQLDFVGSGQHNANDPGSKGIATKSMIVQATNIGGDVGSGQFDIMVPGGGVGQFNACSQQWKASDLGAQYGGFVNACDKGGSHDALKSCVIDKCKTVFSKDGMGDLLKGCLFYVEWFQAANNPQLRYKQVPCPAALTSKSGMSG